MPQLEPDIVWKQVNDLYAGQLHPEYACYWQGRYVGMIWRNDDLTWGWDSHAAQKMHPSGCDESHARKTIESYAEQLAPTYLKEKTE